MENKVISIFALVCLGLAVYLWFNPRIEYETKVVTETIVETVTISKIDTVYITRVGTIGIDIPTPTVIYDTVFVEQPLNKYESPVKDDYFTGLITSIVRGELVSQQFDYKFKSEQITQIDSVLVTKEITNTITRTLRPSGLYFGVQSFNLGENTSIGPSLLWVRPNQSFGYSYDPFNQTHNASIHFRW